MTRVVFDTNVIVSALLFNDSAPARAFTRTLNNGTILVSNALVGEFTVILQSDKLRHG